MLNAIGLQNPGVEKVVDEILPNLDFPRPGSSPTYAVPRWKSTPT